jgi:hypothetical protein
MHAAQTRICFFAPFTNPRTRRKFGFHRRRRVLFAWLITFPKCGPLPHNSHFIAISILFNPPKMFKMQAIILADPAAFSHRHEYLTGQSPRFVPGQQPPLALTLPPPC